MSQILELAHLVEQHRVSEMQVRRGRIEARLDAQGAAQGQPRRELVVFQDIDRAAVDEG